MGSWKKRWEQELDAVIPPLDERVKNAAIEGAPQISAPVKKSFFATLFADRKRFAAALGACVCAVLLVCSSLFFFLSPSAPTTVTAETILVEINPRAAFVLGEDGKVSNVLSMNEDADVILGGGRLAEFNGKTVEQAVELYADYALRLGYLDVAGLGAVRVASYAEDGRLRSVSEALETYFRTKGVYVAVFEETVDKVNFLTELGIADNGKEIEEELKGLGSLYTARQADGKTAAELETLYREWISWGNVKEDLELFIEENLSAYGGVLPAELEAIFEDFTAENFEEEFTSLINLLDGFGVDVSYLRALYELPTSVEEYIEKTGKRIEERYDRLLTEGEAEYGESRAEITAKDYEQYVRKIEAEYGSLSAYWAALKKNK